MSKILVVGDVMVDEYVQVAIERISPEAPIPVMRYVSTEYRPGGAANVAANIESLGGRVELVGVTGLKESFPVGVPGLERCIPDTSRRTTIKRRFVADRGQQVARLDVEDTRDIDALVENSLLRVAREEIPGCEVIVISDYCKGVVTERVSAEIMRMANGRPVIVATKRADLSRFVGAHFVVVNEREWESVTRLSAPGLHSIIRESEIVVTLGERGALIRSTGEIVPARKVDVGDVTGAGDTFVAAFAHYFAEHIGDPPQIRDAVEFANMAASIAVSQRGTTAVKL